MINIYRDIHDLPSFTRAVITIGTFDGVHPGHLQLIDQLKKVAAEINGTAVVITFHPHPKHIIQSDKKPVFVLNTLEEKSTLLQRSGIEHLVVVPFNSAFAEQSAENYISNFLVKSFHPHTIIIGYDHRFGHNREGDYRLLEAKAAEHNYRVIEIPEHVLRNIAVSSTRIREALLAGDIEKATQLLGYRYFFKGEVTEGNKLGRTIGYPTANLVLTTPEKLVPANGVYAVIAEIENSSGRLKGMMNIGIRPTVNGKSRQIEVHLFDFDAAIYGKKLTVTLVAKLRDEKKFTGLEELKEQLGADAAKAVELLKGS